MRTVGKWMNRQSVARELELTVCADPIDAPNTPTEFSITFEKGIPVKLEIGGETITGSLTIFKKLNDIGRDNG